MKLEITERSVVIIFSYDIFFIFRYFTIISLITMKSCNPVSRFRPSAVCLCECVCINVQNPLDTFLRSFPVDGEVANVLRTSYTGKLV